MLLSDLETAVRQDLFDPVGSSSQRWGNADIDRAIDKAVDRYSQYAPNLVSIDMATQPYQRTYPYPISWNSAYPVWWIERIHYPLQVYGSTFTPPVNAGSASISAGSGLSIGSYQYVMTFLTPGGESTPSASTSISTTSGNQHVTLTALPLGPSTLPPGNATTTVIGRNLYRTQVGGSTFLLLTTLQDNSTSSYSDTTPDSALTGHPQPPTVNTSGVMLWPPRERAFAEYSNLFESTTALAAGGNLGTQGSVGVGQGPTGTATPSFTLALASAELPQNTSQVMRIFYATKHQLDANGATIPEVHRDIIILGAVAYALQAYQVPTNDNFDFQDGALHDRVNDTNIPQAWLTVAQARLEQFERRLQEVKQQRDMAYAARVHWGNIPVHWHKL